MGYTRTEMKILSTSLVADGNRVNAYTGCLMDLMDFLTLQSHWVNPRTTFAMTLLGWVLQAYRRAFEGICRSIKLSSSKALTPHTLLIRIARSSPGGLGYANPV